MSTLNPPPKTRPEIPPGPNTPWDETPACPTFAPTALFQLARANIAATYLTLAQAVPGSTIRHTDGLTLARGPWPLSFCKYALGLPQEPKSDLPLWQTLAREAEQQNGLWLFHALPQTPDFAKPSQAAATIVRQGFEPRQCLAILAHPDPAENQAPPNLAACADETCRACHSPAERAEVALFMAEQFFHRSPRHIRRLLAQATADSDNQILVLRARGRPVAAMMVNTNAATGLYNLCVHPAYRRNGLGAALVQIALQTAAQKNQPLVLQCDPALRNWYQSLGFVQIGTLHAFHRDPSTPGNPRRSEGANNSGRLI